MKIFTPSHPMDERQKLASLQNGWLALIRRGTLLISLAIFLAIPLLYWGFQGKVSYFGVVLTFAGTLLLAAHLILTHALWLETMEQERKLNHRLMTRERLNSLGSLAYGIAHELNTPLTALSFIIHTQDSLPNDIKEKLSYEIDRMGKITRGLLAFARPTGVEILDLNNLLRSSESLIRNMVPKDVVLEITLSHGAEPLRSVPNEILQILLNTVHNCVDALHGRENGKITISTLKSSDSGIRLEITDNGPGIPRATLSRILDPFFTTKPAGKGTGLGLFIVHEIVRGHNGIVEIDSEIEKGTTVRIILPRAQELERKAA